MGILGVQGSSNHLLISPHADSAQRSLISVSFNINTLLAALGKGLLRKETEALGLNEGSGLFMDLIYPCDSCPQLTQALKS